MRTFQVILEEMATRQGLKPRALAAALKVKLPTLRGWVICRRPFPTKRIPSLLQAFTGSSADQLAELEVAALLTTASPQLAAFVSGLLDERAQWQKAKRRPRSRRSS